MKNFCITISTVKSCTHRYFEDWHKAFKEFCKYAGEIQPGGGEYRSDGYFRVYKKVNRISFVELFRSKDISEYNGVKF